MSADKGRRAPGGNNQRWKPKLGYRNHFPSDFTQVTLTRPSVAICNIMCVCAHRKA